MPGEPERKTRRKRLSEGIPLNLKLREELYEIATLFELKSDIIKCLKSGN